METKNYAVVLICIILFSSLANAYGSLGNEFYFIFIHTSSLSNNYVVNLVDGVKSTSTKYESSKQDKRKHFVVNLLDGMTVRNGHKKPKAHYVDGIAVERKFISIKIVDGISTRSTNFDNDDLVIINNDQNQATRERIFLHERIKNPRATLFQSIQMMNCHVMMMIIF